MRIMKIDVAGTLAARGEGLDLSNEAVRSQLHRELEALRPEIAERIRSKAVVYLPAAFTTFVRVSFDKPTNSARATFWIDDPTAGAFDSLFARRAWKVTVPILGHVVREAMQERLQTLTVDVNEKAARITAFAPSRSYSSPLAVAVLVALVSAVYWLYAHGTLISTIKRWLG